MKKKLLSNDVGQLFLLGGRAILKKFLIYGGMAIIAVVLYAFAGGIGKFVGRSAVENYQKGKLEGTIEKAQEQAAQTLSKQLPIKIDDITTLYSVVAAENALIYNYRMDVKKENIDIVAFHNGMTKQLNNNVCGNKKMKWSIGKGARYKYLYTGQNGLFIDEITVDKCL